MRVGGGEEEGGGGGGRVRGWRKGNGFINTLTKFWRIILPALWGFAVPARSLHSRV